MSNIITLIKEIEDNYFNLLDFNSLNLSSKDFGIKSFGKMVISQDDRIYKIIPQGYQVLDIKVAKFANTIGIDFFLPSKIEYCGKIMIVISQEKLTPYLPVGGLEDIPEKWFSTEQSKFFFNLINKQSRILHADIYRQIGEKKFTNLQKFCETYHIQDISNDNCGYDKEGKIKCHDFEINGIDLARCDDD